MKNSRFLHSFFTLLVLFITISITAQTGTIIGKVVDDATAEDVIGANIVIVGTTTGTTSDFDGTFSIDLDAGVHSLEFIYMGSAKQIVTDIEVKAGEVTNLGVISMIEETNELDVVVVTAKAVRNTENALMKLQQKSLNVLDAVSSQAISRSGDSDAGEAIQRVTGVTVQDGKNVFVRGLGDRYTKTILNSMEIPGLDPDRNTVQMDIFPTSILDNIIVYKTFTPNLSGDFTGGTVDISLKDYPEEKSMNISGSLGFNPYNNLNSDYLTYNSATTDGLGLGANSRSLPINSGLKSLPPGFGSNMEVDRRANAFDKEMSADRATSFLNSSFGFSFGNKIRKEKTTVGFNVALGYKNTYIYNEGAEFNDYLKNTSKDITELELSQSRMGDIGTHEVLWSGLLNGSIRKGNSAYSLSLFHTQDGIKKTSIINSEDFINTSIALEKNILYYNQRNISNLSYKQKHDFSDKLMLQINVSPSVSMNKEPDIRETTFAISDEGNYLFDTGAGAALTRTYRDLLEISNNTKIDLEWKFKQWNGKGAKLLGGLAHLYKNRDFSIVMYNFRNQGLDLEFTGNPDQIFEEQNLYSATTNEGFWIDGQRNPSDRFQSNINITAGYIMNELPVSDKLTLVYGLRVEHAQMRYTGERQVIQTQNDVYNNQKVLDELDFLPSVNATYKLKDNMNFRFAGSKTLVRPSFKEKSLAQILDPITGITFIGNVDNLEQTDIYNLDLRWEYFFNTGEMVSLTTFYKYFDNPIEIVAFQGESPTNITPRNADNARVIGLEFELKKKLTFISSSLENLSIGMNVTYVNSRVKMTQIEYEDRLLELRTGETTGDTRTMQGQSPYIVNAYLNYNDVDKGIEGNISYNVQGESLQVVGIRRNADVFMQSFHGLNMKVAKRLGKENKWKISVSAKNMLNQKRFSVYRSFQAEDQIWRSIRPGVGFSFGASYTM
jgi:hypothetical protein